METLFVEMVEAAERLVEATGALLLIGAALEGIVSLARMALTRRLSVDGQRVVWLRMARWLVLALEFQLTADLLHTAISQTWEDIGRVAALALIRTFLNYALEADLEKLARRNEAPAPKPAEP